MRYVLFNPNKFLVPVMLKTVTNELEQINLQPKASLTITSEQMTDNIKNLTSSRKNILRMKSVKD